MNLYAVPPIITGVLIFIIGLIVYFNNRKAKANIIFSLFCLSMVVWLFGFCMMYLSGDDALWALRWARLGFIGIGFIPILAFHFILVFTNKPNHKLLIPTLYVAGAISVLAGQTDLVYSGVGRYFWGFYPVAGPLYFIFLLMFAILFSYGIVLLFLDYLRLKREMRSTKATQTLYVLIAFAGGTAGLVDYIIKYRLSIYPFGYLAALFFIAVIAYAITKHHLMDVQVIIKKTAVYSLMTGLITGLFVSLIYVGQYLFRGLMGFSSLWAGIVGAFIIALIFQPLRDGVQALVDRIFFRARYDYQRILGKYSHTLSQPMADLNRFSRIAPYLLTKAMKLTGGSFMVLDRATHNFVVRAGEKDAHALEGKTIAENSPLLKELMYRKREISLEEVNSIIKFSDDESEKTKHIAIAEEMKGLNAVLIIPCISDSLYFKKSIMLSTINLGKKLSEESFSREDINFLDTLANQATISIEYAFIFEELQKNQERVVRSEKLAAIGTTTAGVAHELKNPLTYLSAVAQVLPKKWDDPKFRESVGQMLPSEVKRMQLIVEGLLDYSRSRELVLKPLDIRTVVDKALALLAYEIKKKKVYIKTDYDHKRKVNGDPNRLMQVFMNLLANAVQAMGDKGGDLTVVTNNTDGEVRINIRDTGPGIPQEKLKKIFDPFFTTKDSGTGLGLPISKKIIDEHKGSIYVDSKKGEGTTFTICLPVA